MVLSPLIAEALALLIIAAPFASSEAYAHPVSLLQTRVQRNKEEAVTTVAAETILPISSPQGSLPEIASTLQTLDANHDGRVDPSEVLAFASVQGLDAKSITNEFSSLDANGDGTLDAAEIAQALSMPDASTHGASTRPSSTQSLQQSSMQAGLVSPPAAQAATPAVSTIPAIPQEMLENSENQTLPDRNVIAVAQQHDQGAKVQVKAPSTVFTSPLQGNLSSAPLAQVDSNNGGSALQEIDRVTFKEDMTQSAAALVATQLGIESQQTAEAQRLDLEAVQLRANAAALSRTAVKEAIEAGERAAMAESEQVVKFLEELELGAKSAEVQAASLRAQAAAEMKQANDYSSIADIALRDFSRKVAHNNDATTESAGKAVVTAQAGNSSFATVARQPPEGNA